jgi:hypothetical protein
MRIRTSKSSRHTQPEDIPMASPATPYDLSNVPGAHKKRRGLVSRLPRLRVPRVAALGGGLGLIVVALGLFAIGLGWNGMAGGGGQVSGVTLLQAQLPWLVSGGILGLALVVLGGAMMIVHNARTDRSRLEAKLDELVTIVARSAMSSVQAYPGTPGSTEGLFAAGGASYHQPDCRLVQGRDEITFITAAEVADRDLRACRVCKPASVETLAT